MGRGNARGWSSLEREISKQITGCFQIVESSVTEGGDRALLGWMVKEDLLMRTALDDKRRQLWEDMWTGWAGRGEN